MAKTPETEFAGIDNAEAAYETEVYVNGLGSSETMWQQIIEAVRGTLAQGGDQSAILARMVEAAENAAALARANKDDALANRFIGRALGYRDIAKVLFGAQEDVAPEPEVPHD